MSDFQLDYDGVRRSQTEAATDKSCPRCGGVVAFSPENGMLHCPYCENDFPVEEFSPNDNGVPAIPGGQGSALKFANSNAKEIPLDMDCLELASNQDWGVATKRIVCKSCGAETIYDELEIANSCPYCGSNHIMQSDCPDTMAPGGVVPFSISVQQAAAKFKSWLKGKLFTPSAAKKCAEPEAFEGVYLPYWTFDAQTNSTYTARYGIDRTYTDKDGNSHTTTEWYRTSGSHSEFIDDELVAASTQHDDRFMQGIAPFDTNNAKAYRPEYLAGFAAERYSVGLKDAWEKAKSAIRTRLESNITSEIRCRHNADHVSNLQLNTQLSDMTFKYLLLPVWISSFCYKGKVYQFMVNGQTGRVSGTAPVSALRVILAIFLGLLFAYLLYRAMAG